MSITISNQLISDEAKKHWIDVKLVSIAHNLIELSFKWEKRIIRRSRIPATSWVLSYIADNKEATYDVMDYYWYSYPKSIVCDTFVSALWAIDSIWFPLVIKPECWAHWKWVTTNINNKEELENAFNFAKTFNDQIIIQKFFVWFDFRILVVWNKLRAVAKRIPARIYWDGDLTLNQLINKENENPLRWDGHQTPLTKIIIDNNLKEFIKEKWIDLEYIPKKWEEIFLRKIWNLSQGWEAEDITDEIPKENIKLFEDIALCLNANIVWIDVLSKDLTKVLWKNDYSLIEVNVSPWIRMHHFPSKWKQRNIAKYILIELFPNAF